MFNFVQQYDLLCRKDSQEWLGRLMIIGVVAGLLFVPSLGDKYSRKNVFLSCLTAQLAVQFVLLQQEAYEILQLGILVLAFTWSSRLILSTQFLLEFFPQESRLAPLFAIILLNTASIGLFPLMISSITVHDSMPILIICFTTGLVCLIFVILLIPDSPYSTYQVNDFAKTR